MPEKEAKVRSKINKLLEESGWRLLDISSGGATNTITKDLYISNIWAFLYQIGNMLETFT